jgi:hypothetical protein
MLTSESPNRRLKLIEVQECWLTFTLNTVMRADYIAADSSGFADVIFLPRLR